MFKRGGKGNEKGDRLLFWGGLVRPPASPERGLQSERGGAMRAIHSGVPNGAWRFTQVRSWVISSSETEKVSGTILGDIAIMSELTMRP